MKKIVFLILSTLVLMFFCGCGSVDILCKIDGGNTATMEIQIVVDSQDMDSDEYSAAYYAFEDLSVYWRNALGYDVDEFISGSLYGATLTKSVKCRNTEEAVQALLEMMGSEGSPFMEVEGGYVSSNLYDCYNVDATVDLTQLVDRDYFDTLPASEREYMDETLDKFKGKVMFDFDVNVTDYKGTLAGGRVSADLSLDQPTEIYSLVEISNLKNQCEYDNLINETEQLQKTKSLYLILMIAAAGVVVIASVIIIVIAIMRKSGKDKNAAESPESVPSPDAPQPSEEDKEK